MPSNQWGPYYTRTATEQVNSPNKSIDITEPHLLAVERHLETVSLSIPRFPTKASYIDNWRDIPIYIINRNNLERGFRRQVEWLQSAGMTCINVLDNNSSYPPLLSYYSEIKDRVNLLLLHQNFGPYAFWDRLYLHQRIETRYIISDADIAPDKDCPKDLVLKMLEVFNRQSGYCMKVGPGLRIDNIPDCYTRKQEVIAQETQFALPEKLLPEKDAYISLIDTTFAVYGEHSPFLNDGHHFRLAAPYVAEHVPWYDDLQNPSQELTYYKGSCENSWSHW